MMFWDLQSNQSSCYTDAFAKYAQKSSVARKTYTKTLKYGLSLGSGFPNKPKIVNHQKISMGDDKNIAFIPRSAIPKSFLFLARRYNGKTQLLPLYTCKKEEDRVKKRKM